MQVKEENSYHETIFVTFGVQRVRTGSGKPGKS